MSKFRSSHLLVDWKCLWDFDLTPLCQIWWAKRERKIYKLKPLTAKIVVIIYYVTFYSEACSETDNIHET